VVVVVAVGVIWVMGFEGIFATERSGAGEGGILLVEEARQGLVLLLLLLSDSPFLL